MKWLTKERGLLSVLENAETDGAAAREGDSLGSGGNKGSVTDAAIIAGGNIGDEGGLAGEVFGGTGEAGSFVSGSYAVNRSTVDCDVEGIVAVSLDRG